MGCRIIHLLRVVVQDARTDVAQHWIRAPSKRKNQQKNSTNLLKPNTLAETSPNYYTPAIGIAGG
eukprot:scaffold18299_cov117-Isochrysis_galbana.AAC.2